VLIKSGCMLGNLIKKIFKIISRKLNNINYYRELKAPANK
jgi:hypothetical protein